MQIKVHLKIFLFFLLFFLTGQIEIYAVLLFFAFLHELGHLLAGIVLGFKPKSFHIMPFGFCITFDISCEEFNQKRGKANRLALKRLGIALAGPLVNFIFLLFFLVVPISTGQISRETLIYANLLLIVFNLLPIYPLDGGRAIKEFCFLKKGLKKSMEYTNKLSNGTVIFLTALASIAIYYYKNIAILLIIIYLWWITIRENQYYRMKTHLYTNLEKENTILSSQEEFLETK